MEESSAMAAAAALVKREFDVVVMGATGFSGKLLAEYLVKAQAMAMAGSRVMICQQKRRGRGTSVIIHERRNEY